MSLYQILASIKHGKHTHTKTINLKYQLPRAMVHLN